MPTLRLGTPDDLDAVHAMQLEWEREESVWGFTADGRVDLDRWPAGYFVSPTRRAGSSVSGMAVRC
jgi:hypothetical protein